MSDSYTEVTTKGYGQRIIEALTGIIAGILLFFSSFFVLYRNEGKVNVAELAKTSTPINNETNLSDYDGKFISTTGKLYSSEKIGDTFLKKGNFLIINRYVEMYGWKEITTTKTEKNVGGSETTTTEYKYEKKWLTSPESGENFRYPDGHRNPEKLIKDTIVRAKNLKIDNFSLQDKVNLPFAEEYSLTDEEVILGENIFKNGNYIYKPYNFKKDKIEETSTGTQVKTTEYNFQNPQLGDIRISYSVLKNPIEKSSVFGKLSGKSEIVPFIGERDTEVYRAFVGSRDDAIKELEYEHKLLTWGLRILGFLMMWFGLTNIFKVVSVLLDVIPFLGSIARFGIGFVTFFIALILSIITIIISMIIHNIWALIITIALILWFGYNRWKKGKKEEVKKT